MTDQTEFKIDFAYFDKLEQERVDRELKLNFLGYFPVLSTLSGLIRLIEGQINEWNDLTEFSEHYAESVAAVEVKNSDPEIAKKELEYHTFYANKYWELQGHADASSIRAIFEAIPLANVGCFLYDKLGNRHSYQIESAPNESLFEEYRTYSRSSFRVREATYHHIQSLIYSKILKRLNEKMAEAV